MGVGAKVLSVTVRGGERAQGGRGSSQMHRAWRGSEWGLGSHRSRRVPGDIGAKETAGWGVFGKAPRLPFPGRTNTPNSCDQCLE